MTTETTTTTTTEQVPNKETTSALDQLVGPGKKFQDQEALAKGKLEADAFVENLKRETRELRTLVTAQDVELAKLKTKVSILDRLDGSSTEVTTTTDTTNNTTTVTPTIAGLSEADTLKLIEKVDLQKRQTANKQEVDSVLNTVLGDKAVGFVKQKAAELGISDAEAHNLALNSPKAFLSMFGIQKTNSKGNSMYVPAGTNSAPGNVAPVRNKAYYDKVQKDMGIKKFIMDKGIQGQMHRDMQTLGDDYFS